MSEDCLEKIEELLREGFLYAGFREAPTGQIHMLFFKPTTREEKRKEKK